MSDIPPVLEFQTISERLRTFAFPEVHAVVGILMGGMVPAALVAQRLGKPLHYLQINYRAPDNSPQRPQAELLKSVSIPQELRRILIVDDVGVSGSTFAAAREALGGREVITFAIKGRADLVLLPEVRGCVSWPWPRVERV
ncbi:MAG: phosphoribosyltransferase [Verrucomicrobiota bacterium]|nr:phosphoribosyltransferase [Verrucomicrobiota bacterium]